MRSDPSGLCFFLLQLIVVVGDKFANLFAALQQAVPLLLIKSDGKSPEAVNGDSALLAYLDRDGAFRRPVGLQCFVFGSQTFEFSLQVLSAHWFADIVARLRP